MDVMESWGKYIYFVLVDNDNYTLLHIKSLQGNQQDVNFLLINGAKDNADGDTPCLRR